MITLYDNPESGNCYKVRLLLSQLEVPFESVQISVFGDREASRRKALFDSKTIGKIPTIEFEDGTQLSESTAILWYLAEGTPFLPADKMARSQVLQWMAFEQNNHEPNIATARHRMHTPGEEVPAALLQHWRDGGDRALTVMEGRLTEAEFLAADCYTIADIALFAYTHVADEGPFDLRSYSAIGAWMDRIRSQPGWVPMR